MKRYLLPLLFLFLALPAFSQFVLRSTLIGTGTKNTTSNLTSWQGTAVSISADGNVAVVCGRLDSAQLGAAWVYTRNGNQWVQMGKKLVPTGFAYNSQTVSFGSASAISSNGNTIGISGYFDNNSAGATWIFERSGNTWIQQGPKLVGTQHGTTSRQGEESISLSADGNTLFVGAQMDNGNRGAVWIFQRTGTTWSQIGSKLSPTPNNGWSFGSSVSLSADGNTALIGAPLEGPSSNNLHGAAYIYKRNGSTWALSQKIIDPTATNCRVARGVALSGNGLVAALGNTECNSALGTIWIYRFNPQTQVWVKEQVLNPTNALSNAQFGIKIAISKSGDTLAASGYSENSFTGAVWTFTRNNGVWSSGTKILSPITGGTQTYFGRSLSLSADGKILLIGRPGSNAGPGQGAAFVYTDPLFTGTKEDLQAALKLYPNPVQDFLQLPADHTFSHLTVSDLTGKVLLRSAAPGQRLDLSRFSSGVYLVSLHQKDKVQHVRIVKE